MATSYELYYRPTCPFCRKVLNFMEQNSVELPLCNISSDDSARAELERVGGKVQVPCLFIDGKPLYESDDIITYLKENVA
ncbi:glutaredoxin family protein [Collinsella vaginalis]|uniref:glutaredoxin family protein n=1 Tax=Collinsella vaginalis TaxID=1870987 RepID=UPI000A2672D3|nr:glutaredoxin [Collinsella vaginalis]